MPSDSELKQYLDLHRDIQDNGTLLSRIDLKDPEINVAIAIVSCTAIHRIYPNHPKP